MKSVAYSRAKLTKTAVGCPILAVAGLACLGHVGPFISAIILIGSVLLAACGVQGARKLLGDATALRYDRDRLTIATMWSESCVRWSDVAEVGTSALNTYAFYGLIKVGSTQYLDIKMRGGLMAKKYRLLGDMLDLDKAGLTLLVEDLAAHQLAAEARPGTLDDAAVRVPQWAASAPQAELFDPDAALANYLRRQKAKEQRVSEPVAAPGFGRRDSLEGVPPAPLTGARPGGFGRKIV
ncbi:hypothetical protein [Sphingopyxis sp.]|uniref:hypothetical protein n=1 Tax=Sphingopyxis sp. TaxID=1908224 RepID=UPI0035B45B16